MLEVDSTSYGVKECSVVLIPVNSNHYSHVGDIQAAIKSKTKTKMEVTSSSSSTNVTKNCSVCLTKLKQHVDPYYFIVENDPEEANGKTKTDKKQPTSSSIDSTSYTNVLENVPDKPTKKIKPEKVKVTSAKSRTAAKPKTKKQRVKCSVPVRISKRLSKRKKNSS